MTFSSEGAGTEGQFEWICGSTDADVELLLLLADDLLPVETSRPDVPGRFTGPIGAEAVHCMNASAGNERQGSVASTSADADR